ncbi:MAG TPA: helix-turn-helix domain-containing protein [Alicyclobacillus sp.]|nr:helix-turn-helix domain-containing protein [Alicyclobacillus sp.]
MLEPDDLSRRIGQILRSLRRDRGWTLDKMAAVTGVSKPMLGQIERGESNPTVVTLWKIAAGLGVPFSTFLQDPDDPRVAIVPRSRQPGVEDDDGGYVVRSLVTAADPQPAELFHVFLAPGCTHRASAHGAGVTELIWVQKGRMDLEVGEKVYSLDEGDAARFVAHLDHRYKNPGTEDCLCLILLLYPRLPGVSWP